MTLFRPCIDLHQGQVKQIVGGSLKGESAKENFVSELPPAYFAELYRQHNLTGGHVIALGAGNDLAAKQALEQWPGGLQFGGGVNVDNAIEWLDAGASHVIVTSAIFQGGELDLQRLEQLRATTGAERLVLDLSCRRVKDAWYIATNRWQTITSTAVTPQTLDQLSQYCAEFLIHAADVEGLQGGIDEELVAFLSEFSPLPTTYAGGARHLDDLLRVNSLSAGRIDLTIGSALDIFGGNGVTLDECIAWNQRQ